VAQATRIAVTGETKGRLKKGQVIKVGKSMKKRQQKNERPIRRKKTKTHREVPGVEGKKCRSLGPYVETDVSPVDLKGDVNSRKRVKRTPKKKGVAPKRQEGSKPHQITTRRSYN